MKFSTALEVAIAAIVFNTGHVNDKTILWVATAMDPDCTMEVVFRATEVTFTDGSVARFAKD